MQKLWTIYHQEIPTFIQEFSSIPLMQRLKNIGMNCGLEYTQFELFKNCQSYTRYDHSIGVALIIWHFTHDQAQTIAGLLHDVATPVFAHTIDFLNGDYLNQESTENGTREIIEKSSELKQLLIKHQIAIDRIVDYHQYPIADNGSPQLSADRLEYSLSNMLNYGYCTIKDINLFYNDLIISKNEYGVIELMFQSEKIASLFTINVLKNSRVYISDADRFSMQALANLIQIALDNNIISKKDLYLDEPYVINQFLSNAYTSQLWQRFTQYSIIKKELIKPNDNWFKINAKKRYIDPFIINTGRMSSISKELNEEIKRFKARDFNYYLSAQ